MNEIFLMKLGEVVLKGLNRRTFEEALMNNLRYRLRHAGDFTLRKAQSTIFIEPMAVVEANNELRMLQSKEEHEIERILAELSASVSEYSDSIWLNYRNITELGTSA